MAEPIPERMTARVPHEFAIFLIGMRVNAWWRPDLWLPVALAMQRMLRELRARPEAGLLGVVSGGLGNPTVLVQYWRSVEQLMTYATQPDAEHFPAWAHFQKKIAATRAVGIWHETYVVRGDYECIYHNMPRFGLGAFGQLEPAHGARSGARARLAASAPGPRSPRG
jgi:hypothetical protein